MTETTTASSALITAAIAIPTGKARALLQFNKITGAFVSALSYVDPLTLNNEYFHYADQEFDFHNDAVVGEYPDYKVVDKLTLKPTIYEAQMDLMVQDKITKVYPVIKQVNVIAHAVNALAQAVVRLQPDADPELLDAMHQLNEMRDYINEIKQTNDLRKEFYATSSDFDYQTIEDLEQVFERQLEGGLHEAYGARQIKGGSVF